MFRLPANRPELFAKMGLPQPKELCCFLLACYRMALGRSQSLVLDPNDIVLLDQALRIAYTRLIDAGLRQESSIAGARDILVATIASAISHGDRDTWRLARRGIFAACEIMPPSSFLTH